MTCEGCAVHIQANLAKLPGVRSTRVRYDDRQAVVLAEPFVDAHALTAAVEAADYKVRELSSKRMVDSHK
jgi:copper chaperone CopZ